MSKSKFKQSGNTSWIKEDNKSCKSAIQTVINLKSLCCALHVFSVWIHVLDNVVYSVISFACVLYVCVCVWGQTTTIQPLNFTQLKNPTSWLHTCDTLFPVHVWPEARNIHQVMLQVGGRTPRLPGATCTPGFHSHWKSKGICFVALPRCTLVHWDIKQSCQSGPDCRKQSQEMEMHCVTTSTTLGYLFGQIFPFFLWESPPQDFSWYPSDDVWALGGKKTRKKSASVSCSSSRLQGGISSRLLHPKPPPPPNNIPRGESNKLISLLTHLFAAQTRTSLWHATSRQRQRKSERGYWL